MQRHILRLVVLAVCLGALTACADPAKGKPQAAVSEPEPQAAAAAPAATDATLYRLSTDSKIGFVGSKVTGSHDGGFTQFEGEVRMVDGDPTQSSVHVLIDTTSLWANHPKLTEHLKSPDFFDVATFPTAQFDSTSIVAEGEGFTITGNLQLHGVEKTISFPATVDVQEAGIVTNAEFAIKRFDFAIEYKGMADDLIRDDVLIKLELLASADQS
jgi:polyisoprenoid-binding protein YceI